MGDFYEELLEGLKPLPETVPWLLEQGELGKEEILYQQEYTWDPLTGMRERSVRCICTACQGTWYATKVHVNGCSLGYAPAPFGFMAAEEQVRVYHGETTVCPCCGAEALAVYTGREQHVEQFMCGCNVMEVRRIADKLVLAEWNMRKLRNKTGSTRIAAQPWTAFVLEKKTMIRMSGQCRTLGGWSYYEGFRRRKTYMDDMGECDYIAPWDPALLVGTEGENSKLDLYISATAETGCYPVSYLKIWQKHRNLENLLTVGMGRLVGEMIAEEYRAHSDQNCCRRTLKLEYINFKEKRPSLMLGMETALFREAAGHWDLRTLRAYRWLKESGEAYTIPEDLALARKHWDERATISDLGLPTENTSTDSQKSEVAGASGSSTVEKLTYESIFYRPRKTPKGGGGNRIYGFPMVKGNWCTSDLKQRALRQSGASIARENSNSAVLRGFPISVHQGNWCTALKQRVFRQHPGTRCGHKYRAIPRNCGRRTRTDQTASETRHHLTSGGSRLG